MLQGDPVGGGWRDEHVREALDLCLSCKGCKSDCPVHVDMATYKAEFLSHYYARRLRPRTAYAMGLIHWWARMAAVAPGLVNAVTQSRALSPIVKSLGGISPHRTLPRFARQTFRAWFRRRPAPDRSGPRVVLWPDTFNDHFHPETARAAAEALEALGWTVVLPRGTLCCGRPLYDWGMLDLARRLLRRVLAALRDEIAAGTPIVVLEPSCLAVFRDEALNLLARDDDAYRLSRQTYTLGEFLRVHASEAALPKLTRRAIVHGHCHQKALTGLGDEKQALQRLGLDFTVLDAGCCGMAGAFGFEKDKYDVSVQAGERVLLPAVRAADDDVLVVADGFSCREQIAQATARRALHLAEVLDLARRESADRTPARGAARPQLQYTEQDA
jgi:Fe-S oxidoreductase